MNETGSKGQKPEIEALRALALTVEMTNARAGRQLQAAIDASKELLRRVAERSGE